MPDGCLQLCDLVVVMTWPPNINSFGKVDGQQVIPKSEEYIAGLVPFDLRSDVKKSDTKERQSMAPLQASTCIFLAHIYCEREIQDNKKHTCQTKFRSMNQIMFLFSIQWGLHVLDMTRLQELQRVVQLERRHLVQVNNITISWLTLAMCSGRTEIVP